MKYAVMTTGGEFYVTTINGSHHWTKDSSLCAVYVTKTMARDCLRSLGVRATVVRL